MVFERSPKVGKSEKSESESQQPKVKKHACNNKTFRLSDFTVFRTIKNIIFAL